jgi:hypothetical protein
MDLTIVVPLVVVALLIWTSIIGFGFRFWIGMFDEVQKADEEFDASKAYHQNYAYTKERIERYRQEFFQRSCAVNMPVHEINERWLPVAEALAQSNEAACNRSFIKADHSLNRALRAAERIYFDIDRLHLLQALAAPTDSEAPAKA